MGDITRYSQYERNTELNNENILEKCIRRCYAKTSKAQLLEELVNKLIEETTESYDSEDQDERIFEWVMLCGTKKEKAHMDERLCAEENALHVGSYYLEDCLDELPKFKAILEKEQAEMLARKEAQDNYALLYNLAVGGA